MEREDETEPGEKLTKQERQGSFLRAGGGGGGGGGRGRAAAREAREGDKGMNQQGKARTREEEARTTSPGGPSPSSTLPAGTERNGRREEEAEPGKVSG